MRAAVVSSPGRLELKEIPLPEPGPGQLRIRSAFCGICGTDLAMLAGAGRAPYPLVLGHEWSGVVDAVGSGVDRALRGERCVAENVLAAGGEVGFEYPGAYGEFFLTEARLVQPLPEALSLKQAALIEPLAVCVRAVRRLRLEDRSSALIFGDGVIGLLLLILLNRRGVGEVTLVGGRQARLEKAVGLGAARAVSYHDAADGSAAALAALVRPAGAGPRGAVGGERGFANILEASGSSAALEAAFELGAPEAHFLLLGDYEHATAAVPWQRWLHREYEVMSSNASSGAWPEAVRLAGELTSSLDPLVTHAVSPDEVRRGIELMRGRSSGAIRVLIDWGLGVR